MIKLLTQHLSLSMFMGLFARMLGVRRVLFAGLRDGDVTSDIRNQIADFLPYNMVRISEGFKYLGFRLKPLGYRSFDWNWLVERFEMKINNWSFRLLSLGGRVILINSVLSGLAVYWFALARCPKSILNKLRKAIFLFLWGSSDGHHKLHLTS